MDKTITTISAREKMRTVILIWKGDQSTHWSSMFHGIPQREIKKWCRAAMRGAREELKNV